MSKLFITPATEYKIRENLVRKEFLNIFKMKTLHTKLAKKSTNNFLDNNEWRIISSNN